MNKTFTITGWETCTQPECNPAFVARLFLESEDGQKMTLFPVNGSTVKEDWKGKALVLRDATVIVAPVVEQPPVAANPA
jgi:hypothetical protein